MLTFASGLTLAPLESGVSLFWRQISPNLDQTSCGWPLLSSEEGVTGRSVRGGHLPKITDSYRGVPRDRPRQAVTTSETAVVTVNKRHNGIKNRIPL